MNSLTSFFTAALSILTVLASSATVATKDGLELEIDDESGDITRLAVDGNDILLNESASLVVEVGETTSTYTLRAFDFSSESGDWNSAQNADWNTGVDYVTWQSNGGVDDSPHMLLGNGATAGAGMAMAEELPTGEARAIQISWQARTATTETLQILNVRAFDKEGKDITRDISSSAGTYTSVSHGHGIWGIHTASPNSWEPFAFEFSLPSDAASIQISLRYWTGGDGWLHVDDLHVVSLPALDWREAVASEVSLLISGEEVESVTTYAEDNLQVRTHYTPRSDHIALSFDVEDTSDTLRDLPLRLSWGIPAYLEHWTWWDDAITSRSIESDIIYKNVYGQTGHEVSLYSFSSLTSSSAGLTMAVPMDEPLIQRTEASTDNGLRSTWEIALSPLTEKIGKGKASFSALLYRHDPTWGFRAATAKYYDIFPNFFAKRTEREGAWLYPIPPSQIPDPEDFGFAFFETRPLGEEEREYAASKNIGIFHYIEPWLAWRSHGELDYKPPIEERIEALQAWARGEGSYAEWQPTGGIDNSGHLLLGDGTVAGAGMAMADSLPLSGTDDLRIEWDSYVASSGTLLILCVRVFDESGNDITESATRPAGWGYSATSAAQYIASIEHELPGEWEHFSYPYNIPGGAFSIQVSLRCWTGGALQAHMDNLQIVNDQTGLPLAEYSFNVQNESWVTAQNSDWDDAGPEWLSAPRILAAQAVLNSAARDENGIPLLDANSYLWHEWRAGTRTQAWPTNPDTDIPDPSAGDIYLEHQILEDLWRADGMYIDSVTGREHITGWPNYNESHIAVNNHPITFAADGRPMQIGIQPCTKFLTTVRDKLNEQNKLLMFNLFPNASRFFAHIGDTHGSETWHLVESDEFSLLRRTFAKEKIVTNLLQYNWDRDYASKDDMEDFILSQLFYGFYPAVSSAGGPLDGGTPDRYFLHPELYERDRPLFQKYMPIIKKLSTAGWQPIPHARVSSQTLVERFGDGRYGVLYFTLKNTTEQQTNENLVVDIRSCGLHAAVSDVKVHNLIKDEAVEPEEVTNGVIRIGMALNPGEITTLQISVPNALSNEWRTQ